MVSPPSTSCSLRPAEDEKLIYCLYSLTREIADLKPSTPISILQEKNISLFFFKNYNLSVFFEDLLFLRESNVALSPLAIIYLQEILSVLRRFRTLLRSCFFQYSRTRLVLQSNSISDDFHHLNHELSNLLHIFPIHEVDVSNDVKELVSLVANQCRKSDESGNASREELILDSMLAMVNDIERQITPERSRLETIFQKLGINSSETCKDEIAKLETEIRDEEIEGAGTEKSFHGLVQYAKCVLFGASTPSPRNYATASDEIGQLNRTFSRSTVDVPDDFRCPISLDFMKDPVVVESGQTYDRDSMERWIKSGHTTCPKTGQSLTTLRLVPNLAINNLIKQWCRDQKLSFDDNPSTGYKSCATTSKAALEAAKMTATFLVKKLSSTTSIEASDRIVHELLQLSKIGSENRASIVEAGGIPLLFPFLKSSDPSLQVNAIEAILHLSASDSNKKTILRYEGSLDSIIAVVTTGATWKARENAATTLMSLASLHNMCIKKIGKKAGVVEGLVKLVKAGPTNSEREGLRTILCMARVRDNISMLVKGDVISVALDVMRKGREEDDVMETAVAVLASVAKRGGAQAMGESEGFMEKIVWLMKYGSDISREIAAETLVYVCKLGGDRVVEEYSMMPGIEWIIWGMMGSGTGRGKRKAASLGRIRQRWLVNQELQQMKIGNTSDQR
ncbi:U-box domain-containing protein [Zostera marina]|uniref:RING-type E3 ubiquitin transferase n=1 Tax=Zostera marina TaxID=29655 RepID=A0A0K9NVV7_ZOSMR|nr:U-box domain-containing protein [Zostera marina]